MTDWQLFALWLSAGSVIGAAVAAEWQRHATEKHGRHCYQQGYDNGHADGHTDGYAAGWSDRGVLGISAEEQRREHIAQLEVIEFTPTQTTEHAERWLAMQRRETA